MRIPLTSLVLLSMLCPAGAAEPVAVFARNDVRPLSGGQPPAAADQAAFWNACRKDRSAGAKYELELPLMNPPEWGRTVSAESGGRVQYHRVFPHGFVCRISFHDLLPNHPYVLTINGNPLKDGNALLPLPVPGVPGERYYDFLDVKTDAHGAYAGDIGIFLEPARYDVRIYVKDPTDYKIVLYRDFFPFVAQ